MLRGLFVTGNRKASVSQHLASLFVIGLRSDHLFKRGDRFLGMVQLQMRRSQKEPGLNQIRLELRNRFELPDRLLRLSSHELGNPKIHQHSGLGGQGLDEFAVDGSRLFEPSGGHGFLPALCLGGQLLVVWLGMGKDTTKAKSTQRKHC